MLTALDLHQSTRTLNQDIDDLGNFDHAVVVSNSLNCWLYHVSLLCPPYVHNDICI